MNTSTSDLGAIVMAAGLGKRMRSKIAKVLHPVAGRPMVLYPVELAERFAGAGVTVVIGHQASDVKAVLEVHAAVHPVVPSVRAGSRGAAPREAGMTAHVTPPARPPVLIAEQTDQRGTGHAVMQAREAIKRARGAGAKQYLILNGDTPLLTDDTVRGLLRVHESEGAALTILTGRLDDPRGYGRVVRDGDGRVTGIVEDRDASPEEAALREINVGTYVVDGAFLFETLDHLQPQNAQQEYYLTDLVRLAVERRLRVAALAAPDADECLGINSRRQLAAAERTLRARICDRWMEEGVTFRDPATTAIDADVQIGQDTVLHPYVTLEGRTVIGTDCVIRSHVRIKDSTLGSGVTVQDACVIEEARLEDDTVVGPFAHLRPGAVLRRAAKVGNFVEMKKAVLGEGSKANHLSYLGDARIGKNVNIGAGTITCNYDGRQKFETVIEDDVFIGSDTQLIAPVTVGKGAIVAAGSTVSEHVPPDALAIGRVPQTVRPGWAARRRALPPAGEAAARREARGTRHEIPKSSKPSASRPVPRAPKKQKRK